MKIGYIFVIAELFHFGHLQLIMAARKACDKLICGLLTDEAVQAFRSTPITNYTERKQVIEAIRYVDEVVPQHEQNPTRNLKKIREQYSEHELVFICGDNWPIVPAEEYLSSVNARIIKQNFYEKLSNENISIKTIIDFLPDQSPLDTFTPRFVVKDFERFSKKAPTSIVTTKANTLQYLKPLLKKSHIEKTFVFFVADWKKYKDELLDTIEQNFSADTIIVRSSSIAEDSLTKSMAGHFYSELNIAANNRTAIARGVEQVIASYGGASHLDNLNQVLIQKQTQNIRISGVLFTVDLETNSPYYVINYEEGEETDVVTSGIGGKMVKIFRNTDRVLLPEPWDTLLDSVKELEQTIHGFALDIEFAITRDKRVVLFQVRPLAANRDAAPIDVEEIGAHLQETESLYQLTVRETNNCVDGHLVFSDMLLWNPAELIGHNPSNLAYSLFERLIMSNAWNAGLVSLGYPDLFPCGLMTRFLYKPYINVNLAFRAMIPMAVPSRLHSRLLPYFVEKLRKQPHLHDKSECEIMFSCYDFNIADRLRELSGDGFTTEEIHEIEEGLIIFTRDILANHQSISDRLGEQIAALEEFNRTPLPTLIKQVRKSRNLHMIKDMLDICESCGTIPFVSAARLAFIADALFRSLEKEDVISSSEKGIIMNSFTTVASELTDDIDAVGKGAISRDAFMERYGHLRSGTYDIEQPRYDNFFDATNSLPPPRHQSQKANSVPTELQAKISRYTLHSPLQVSFDTLYSFASLFTRHREYFKFVYTRTVSNILELIKEAASLSGINPGDISHLGIEDIFNLFHNTQEGTLAKINSEKMLAEKRSGTILPPIIFRPEDFRIQHYPLTAPNFVTNLATEGKAVCLDRSPGKALPSIDDKIVFIEKADPGFHWIFAYNIKGLVTKYGGICSHMAICCAEFNIPAAIGCGEKYDQLKNNDEIMMNCAKKYVKGKGPAK